MIAMALILVAAYTGLAAWLALRAERRFSRHALLPMQWWADRQPTWYLPRRIALVVFAALCATPLLVSVAKVFAPGIPSDLSGLSTGQTLAFLFGMAAIGVGLFALYLWLVARWDRANL
jgi:hypothetical protein